VAHGGQNEHFGYSCWRVAANRQCLGRATEPHAFGLHWQVRLYDWKLFFVFKTHGIRSSPIKDAVLRLGVVKPLLHIVQEIVPAAGFSHAGRTVWGQHPSGGRVGNLRDVAGAMAGILFQHCFSQQRDVGFEVYCQACFVPPQVSWLAVFRTASRIHLVNEACADLNALSESRVAGAQRNLLFLVTCKHQLRQTLPV
jgi:hypothetical protein